MSHPKWRKWWVALFLAGSLGTGANAPLALAAEYGRVSGTVWDQQGNPLMGASVVIVGPVLNGLQPVQSAVERVITDAQGRFAVQRLLPGWYSLQVTSATRLPVLRNGVRVEAGRTSRQNFVLADILAPLRVKVSSGGTSSFGEDWKWVLRTSPSTRPVLRYQEVATATAGRKGPSTPRPTSQRLVGMIPGSTRRAALAGDPGLGSVLAYLRPLSEDTDLLVAGAMGANGLLASSLATAFRKDVLKGDPQELALVVHQLSFAEGVPLAPGEGRDSLTRAQAIVVSYANTRRLSDSLTLTGGLEINYLLAAQDAMSIRPRARLEYHLTPSNVVAVQYGAVRVEGDSSLLERIGALNAFPRVTVRGYRPKLERLNHAEVSFGRRLTKAARFELAAYRDHFENTAVWGFAGSEGLSWLAGDFLPNPAANGVTINAGNYYSSGVRVAYTQNLGTYVNAAVLYALGDALLVGNPDALGQGSGGTLRAKLRPHRTQSCAGKVTATIPASKTQVTTSYEWLPHGHVTGIDPYGQASFQLQPYLGIQIRQPLPTLAFLPARIEALADFRNLLAQGYVPLNGSDEKSLVLTPAYRSFRGGFSVQF